MMIQVANPIYDSIFKYLVEDKRIAKILISALLKKEVVDVDMRRHEYSNGNRDNISMFRIDFAAHVRESDGTVRLILIELQKTWLETETLRFRQYLGAHYSNPENMTGGEKHEFGMPMVTIYLLGHKVGKIVEPVVYASHKAYDYNGNEIKIGIPDPFVESLVHDSIIVQLPRLRGNIKNNRLDRVLSVFDQSKMDSSSRQMLNIDESVYEGDSDMMYILRRLLAAASNAQLRQDMNVEDEFFSAIETRDTAIMNRDKRIQEQNAQISAQSAQLSQQSAQLSQQSAQLSQQSARLSQQSAQISEKNAQISEQADMLRNMAKGMLANGIDIDSISKMTGKTVEELKELLN